MKDIRISESLEAVHTHTHTHTHTQVLLKKINLMKMHF